VKVEMDGGPFAVESKTESVLRKADLSAALSAGGKLSRMTPGGN
jgi:hypothetical protein